MLFLPRLTPHAIALITFLAWYLILVQDIRHWSYRDPGSVFFDPDRAFERVYSLERQNEAESYIQLVSSADYAKAADNPSLCVGIATIQRDGARYFRDALGSVVAGLTEKERQDIYVVSFIVNVDPNEHQAYTEDWTAVISDQVLTYNDAQESTRAYVQELVEVDYNFTRKPLFDYTYLLRNCYEKGMPFIVMLEDDTIAADGWYHRTKEALRGLEGKHDFGTSLYLRLFYNERLLGWNSEEWMFYTVSCFAVVGALAASLFAIARYYPGGGQILTLGTLVTICLFVSPLCIGLFFAAGRLNLAGPGRGLNRMDSYGCCSQAFVFPRDQVPQLAEWYASQSHGLIDELTEEYANEHGLSRWALTPSVFQHVGTTSSKETSDSRWGRKNTENIWNFSFEMFDREDLKDDHV